MKRSRTPNAAHRLLLREVGAPAQVWIQSYAWGLVRVRIGDRFELTCAGDELRTLAVWACAHLVDAETARLPVDEFRAARWDAGYRWTAAADRQYRDEHARLSKRRAAKR